MLNGQETSVIKMMPHHAQGYLILNNNIDVDYWTVEILRRSYYSDGTYSDEVQERNELIGKNYLKISDEIINDCEGPGYGYVVSTTAHYISGGSDIEDEEIKFPPPSNSTEEWNSVAEWKCNGNTYAWGIHQMLSNIYNCYFTLNGTCKSYTNGIMEYYFQYFSESQWTNFKNSLPGLSPKIDDVLYCLYYNIPNTYFLVDGIQVIKIANDPAITYKDRYGVSINSNWVYGIAKGLGPWGGLLSGQYCKYTPYLLYGNPMGSMPKSWAIGVINQHTNLTGCGAPSLECIDGSFVDPFGPSVTDTSTLEKLSKLELDSIVWIWGEIDSINNLIDPNSSDWWDNYISFSIVDLSNNSGTVFNGKLSDLRDENGTISSPTVNLNPGLYSVNLQYADGSYLSIVREVKSQEISTNLSNHFDYTLYPVPITDNQFNIDIESTARLEVLYKVFDFNLNLLYQTIIHIEKDEFKTLNIEPDISLPAGFLVNQFIFTDGSQVSSVTQKTIN